MHVPTFTVVGADAVPMMIHGSVSLVLGSGDLKGACQAGTMLACHWEGFVPYDNDVF